MYCTNAFNFAYDTLVDKTHTIVTKIGINQGELLSNYHRYVRYPFKILTHTKSYLENKYSK